MCPHLAVGAEGLVDGDSLNARRAAGEEQATAVGLSKHSRSWLAQALCQTVLGLCRKSDLDPTGNSCRPAINQ